MSDTPHRYALEQTVDLGHELGIPLGSLVEQTRKALGIPMDDGDEHPLAHLLGREPIDWDQFAPEDVSERSERPAIDPPETSSDLLTGQKRKCASVNRLGQPCGAYRRPGSQLCPFHDPNLADEMRDSRAEGGRRTTYRLPQHVETNLQQVPLGLHSRVGIQASMEAVMRMVLLGRIPPRHATVLMRYFNGAIRNFRDSNGFSERQLGRYSEVLKDVLLTSGLIERDLEEQARNERLDEIADVRAKREEILQANKTFGYGPLANATTRPPSPRIGYGPNDIRPFHG